MKPSTINGLICMALFLIGLIRELARKKDFSMVAGALKEIDYFTLLLLAGLFIVIAGITKAGVVDALPIFCRNKRQQSLCNLLLLVWASVLFSAFIDNIPMLRQCCQLSPA